MSDKNAGALLKGRTMAADPAYANGVWGPVRMLSSGAILVQEASAASITGYTTGADAETGVVIASAAWLQQIEAYNASANVRYLLIFDLAAVPAPGAAPDWTAPPIPAGQSLSHFFGDTGLPMAAGICWAVSTTRVTYTASGANDLNVSARYRTEL